jgi:polar amino acid transport system substrate-binding protein
MKINALTNWLFGAAILMVCGSGLIAAEPAPVTTTPLRVGVAPVSPPMIFKEGTRIVGVEADFAQALGKELGREITFVELAWEDLIDGLNDGKIDIIMSSMSVTRARQFRVAFSDPYLRVGQMALVRAKEQARYGLLVNSLADRTIGVRKGTTGDLLVQQEFPRAKRKYYKSDDEAAVALGKGKIDLFIDDSTMVWYLAGVYESKGLTVVPHVLSNEILAWGTRRSDDRLRESANAFLRKIQASGELNRILHRWIPKFQ